MPTINRRQFLQSTAATALMLAGRGSSFAAANSHSMAPAVATAGFNADIELDLDAVAGEISVLPGAATRVWQYNGRVVRGNSRAFTFLDGSRHIPVVRVRRGQRIRVNFTNRLPEESIVHWHGLHLPQRMDGHPMYAIGTNQRYVYEFVVDNRAGTYWFHPHPHERTGYQVYHGLAGLFIVGDEEEDAARLPKDEFDLPIVIQDRTFNNRNQLIYLGPGMHDRMMGFSGDRILVNGSTEYACDVGRTAYRIRLFNGSNATLYRLRLSSGKAFTVIGTDGGLLERQLQREYLTLAVGERVDAWLDFATHQPGEELALLAESYGPELDNLTRSQVGAPLIAGGRPIARFRIGGGGAGKSVLPGRLAVLPPLRVEDAINRDKPRTIRLSMTHGRLMLNGRVHGRMDEVADDEKVKLGTTEVWEFANDASFGMQMAHPMHVHNVQFRILGRSGAGRSAGSATSLSGGYIEEGLKDTVLVMPGERVRVLMKFENHSGLYLYHCHILEHEDMGMMRNYLIQA